MYYLCSGHNMKQSKKIQTPKKANELKMAGGDMQGTTVLTRLSGIDETLIAQQRDNRSLTNCVAAVGNYHSIHFALFRPAMS